jgi:dTDP-4-dehydrorhamnose reductase
VNAAGYVNVDRAEHEPERCYRDNVAGPLAVADTCAAHGLPFLTFSSDLVFDGSQRVPYAESDRPRPLNTYGASKYEAERTVLAKCRSALVVRTSSFFGPWDVSNFLHQVLVSLGDRRPWRALSDVVVSPTYVPDLVHACLDLLIDGERGLWHVTNDASISWLDLAREIAGRAGLDATLIQGQSRAEAGRLARLPPFTAMRSERGWSLPTLSDALGRFLHDRAPAPPA